MPNPGTVFGPLEGFALVIVGVGLYFVLVSLLAAWCLLPAAGNPIRATLARVRHHRAAGLESAAAASARHPEVIALALLILLAAPATALWLRHLNAFDGFDHTPSRAANPHIADLLRGEQLNAPAPLPPALFLTHAVEQARPFAAGASRRWELLDEDFRQRLLAVFKLMRDRHGVEMVLVEGYRSSARQAELARLGPSITHAAAGQSLHEYGLAADCALLIDGRVVISEQEPGAMRAYAQFGAIARSAGLVWGGGWSRLRDLGHVELRRQGAIHKSTAVSLAADPNHG